MTDLLIFGTGKVAQVAYAAITGDPESRLTVAGFCLDAGHGTETELFGLPVVSFEDAPRSFPPDRFQMLVAVGYHRLNALRAEKCAAAQTEGYRLTRFVHSRAAVDPTAKLGRNCLVLDNVSIGPFATIGDGVCLFPGAVAAHHVAIANHVWITSGTVIGGNSTIGESCFLGLNSTIAHSISIGARNFIGAGAVVTRSTGDNEVRIVADTPKHRLTTDQFLKLSKFD